MKKRAALTLSLFLTAGVALADTKESDPKTVKGAPSGASRAAKEKEKSYSMIAAELEELRQAIQAQQEQLRLLQSELAKRSRQTEEGSEAMPNTTDGKPFAANLTSGATDAKANNVASDPARQTGRVETKKSVGGPDALLFKGVTLTPGGFFAAESVWRQRAASADINTPFTSIPFAGNDISRISEFNASGRQSRISMLAEGKTERTKFTAYYETDFLSAPVTSNNRQSNSYSLRQRQFWGQATLNSGWSFTGGQMWSLVTETKKGLQNRTELPPMTIDSQYNVGFGWARQYGFRITKSFSGEKFVIGVAAEGPQTTFGGRGIASGTFFINAPGASGGLFNAFDSTGYTVNMAPDFIIKAAVDPGWGHYELFGIISTFRSRVYPCGAVAAAVVCNGATGPSATSAFNDSRIAGGLGAHVRGPLFRKYGDFGIHILGGDGVGRYGSAQLADVTARPNGTLAPIRGGQALGTVELHPSPRMDVYLNYGLEYAFRAWYDTSATLGGIATVKSVGYGSPYFNNSGCGTEVLPGNQNSPGAPSNSTCNGDIRNVQEATLGFWHKVYQGPKGGLRWGMQYSHLVKNTWSGNNNTPGSVGLQPSAVNNMIFTSFRYYLP